MTGIFAVMDDGRMLCAVYMNSGLQNALWEGLAQSKEIANLFLWSFSGKIIHAAINNPTSWHDSKLAVLNRF
eukprot:IDg11666t1